MLYRMNPQGSPTYAFISTTSTTYHPENPLENAIIDNPGLVRRRRRKTSAKELEVLEMAFRECEKPSRQVREEIAKRTGMDNKAVQVLHSSKQLICPTFSTFNANGRFGFRTKDSLHGDYRSLLVPTPTLSITSIPHLRDLYCSPFLVRISLSKSTLMFVFHSL